LSVSYKKINWRYSGHDWGLRNSRRKEKL